MQNAKDISKQFLQIQKILKEKLFQVRKDNQILIFENSKRFDLFFALGIILIVFCLVTVFRNNSEDSSLFEKSWFLGSASSLFTETDENPPFISQYDLKVFETPDLVLFQENTVKGVSSPVVLKPKTLGIFVETEFEDNTKKEVFEYSVRSGDSLLGIANHFNISLDTLLWANDLSKNSVIQPDQKLVILPVSGVLHLVKSGETLGGLTKTYEADINETIAFNNLSEDGEIFKGDILIIPGGKKPPEPQPKSYSAQIPIAYSYFIFPAVGKISQGLHLYNAIDIANKCGTPIYAAAGGTVQSRIGYASVSGNYVRILHPNGVVTLYAHLSKILVKPGQKVSQGQVIGYMGNTGYTVGRTGCHLHFEVRGAKNFLAKYPLGSSIGQK